MQVQAIFPAKEMTALSDDESRSDSATSQPSTDVYLQEPFDTFVHKAHALLLTIFPNDLPIQMERMSGGSYNRVVGGVLRYGQPQQRRVVIRIPRFTSHLLVTEVAVLRFLSNTTIPVPHVLHFDKSSSNILSNPYMILEHLPGSCLGDVYDDMPPDKKILVARSIARLLKQLSEVNFDIIGTLLSTSPDGFGLGIGHMANITDENQSVPPPSPSYARSIRHYLEERWSFFVAEEQRKNPGDTFDRRFVSSFRAAMNKLPIPAADQPARIVLYHTDLAPRNIFINTESGSVTGVLDWDRAESAPVEAAWQMPAWLWDHEASGSNQLKWVSPDDVPLDPQAAEIRQHFIDEIEDVIPGFVNTVRGSKLIFELLTFARRGLYSVEIINDARSFLKRMGIEIRAPGIVPFNVLASKPPESLTPYGSHHPSISPVGNPLSAQTDERPPVQLANLSSTLTPIRISSKEGSTGIDEATSILQGVVITAPSPEALGRGPQASPSLNNTQPPGIPNLTGRIVRLGPRPIAVGGYASIWRGSLLSAASDDPDRALQVVVKVLRVSYTEESTFKRKLSKRLHVEMRIWAQLHHENVVRLLGHTEEPEGPGLVSISYPHGDVLSFLAKNPSVNREIICADVALGLRYLHEHKPRIIHGDLKGPNVLIDGEGRASICDFGLSTILDGSPIGHTSSNFGGSLRFLAPELLEETTRTVETDIYAYACTCIAILFDREPYYELEREAHLMRAIFNHQPPFEPSDEEATFPSFWRILKRCWDHDPMSRPSLNLIIDAIQRCLYSTYRTNMGIHRGIGRRVRFMCLPGIEQGTLISVADDGLRVVVNSSDSLYRVPIYQRYRWELMDRQNLEDSEDDSDVSWFREAEYQDARSIVSSSLSVKDASPPASPPYVSKWKDYSPKFRFPYSLLVSYEPYNEATS